MKIPNRPRVIWFPRGETDARRFAVGLQLKMGESALPFNIGRHGGVWRIYLARNELTHDEIAAIAKETNIDEHYIHEW